jgi:hypothetical protein
VGVGVDQAGHEDAPAAVHGLRGGVVGGSVADGHQGVAGDGDRAGGVLGVLLIHRQEQSIRQKQVAGLGHGSWGLEVVEDGYRLAWFECLPGGAAPCIV